MYSLFNVFNSLVLLKATKIRIHIFYSNKIMLIKNTLFHIFWALIVVQLSLNTVDLPTEYHKYIWSITEKKIYWWDNLTCLTNQLKELFQSISFISSSPITHFYEEKLFVNMELWILSLKSSVKFFPDKRTLGNQWFYVNLLLFRLNQNGVQNQCLVFTIVRHWNVTVLIQTRKTLNVAEVLLYNSKNSHQ